MVFRVVTANPALDRFLILSHLQPGAQHRVEAVETVPAGTGIHVARALYAWGAEVVVYATAGGPAGELFRSGVEQAGIPHVLTPIAGDTRMNVKVVERGTAPRITLLDEPGSPLTASEETAFVESVRRDLQAGDWVVLCDSLPPGVSPALYVACLLEAKERGCRVALDVPGDTLAELLQVPGAAPHVVAPSAAELGDWLERYEVGTRTPKDGFAWIRTPGEVRRALQALAQLGVAHPFATLGPAGAALWTGKAAVRARALEVVPRNTLGAGAVFLAAVLLSLDEKGPVGALRLATALAGLKAAREDLLPPDWFEGEEGFERVSVEAL